MVENPTNLKKVNPKNSCDDHAGQGKAVFHLVSHHLRLEKKGEGAEVYSFRACLSGHMVFLPIKKPILK